MRVESQMLCVLWSVTAAEVHLDEVETALLEVEVGIVLVVVVESDIHAEHIAIVHITACVCTGIAVDSGFKTL